ncbi:MAG: bifunctional YncE family protein/alkaline phosphatase family protein [Solirubrobacterales bacterium]|nr:bifunctional YncE family protein/alkaline phosphatase family protein [Solirubrobacterales bacterium]
MAIASALASCVAVVGVASAAIGGFNPFGNEQVGQSYANGVLLPTNQWISPLGTRILDDNARLLTSAISPNGQYLAALGWNNFQGFLTIVNLRTNTIVSQADLDTGTGSAEDTSVGPDGPLFSSDGSTLWVPQTTWLDKFSFNQATGAATQEGEIALCGSALTSSACNPNIGPSNPSGAYLPAGMALSPDNSTLYVALNGNNTLGVISTQTDTLTKTIPVGNAPRQVVLADNGTVAYVSNEGGRPANGNDFTNLSDGTPIVSSRRTGGAVTGTVSVVDLTAGKETAEIPVGLQPTALYQNGNALFVANSNDDSLSVIDESDNTVAQTVRTNPVPGADIGSYANAINMSDPNHVLVSIGRDNAIGVYQYRGLYSRMRFVGLLPTDWYPVQVQPDPALGAGTIVVTNDKGIGARGPKSTINKGPDTSPATDHNTYDDTGSVTTFTMPADYQISGDTQTVFTDDDWNQIRPINQGDYDTVPRVIPARLGGPSPIKHVLVIVKENRTYDQVLGDLNEGNGDPADAQFGAQVTPNFHTLATRFGDLDNFYDEGTLSADGHNWLVQAEATDYVEKEFGAFYRSYPSQGGDALAYQRDGFLWNAAENSGLSVQNFGEYIYNPYSLPAGSPVWDQWYAESQWLENGRKGPEPISDPCQYTRVQSDIPSLQEISDPCFPNFQLSIPDQYRVDQWLPVFQRQERHGNMPNLTFMWLMTDHTGATGVSNSSTVPYPVAQVADNDLAVGRVIDAISHSRFWKSTAIFVVEDDTQNGVDHVDGHRGPAFVISPYSAGGVNDSYYTQLNMVKTIEQILGIRPMNQEDLAAEPMYGAFTEHPNYTPYNVELNKIPLNYGAPGGPTTLSSAPVGATAAERRALAAQGVVPADMRSVYNAWMAWSRQQVSEHHFDGPDRVNPQLLNRFDWYSAHNWRVAYPGDPQIYTPDEVPGRNLPAAYLGDD